MSNDEYKEISIACRVRGADDVEIDVAKNMTAAEMGIIVVTFFGGAAAFAYGAIARTPPVVGVALFALVVCMFYRALVWKRVAHGLAVVAIGALGALGVDKDLEQRHGSGK